MENSIIIAQTKKWILDVVIGCNFCPFAVREVKRESIHFEVIGANKVSGILEALLKMMTKMNADAGMETSFLIIPRHFGNFASFLKLIAAAENHLKKNSFEGIYQVATFHPAYLFAGSTFNDPANYTNRSPYPMLQLLREDSMSRAIESYPDTQLIPQRNIAFAKEKGLAYMQNLRAACMKPDL